jgi:hypothetical protein
MGQHGAADHGRHHHVILLLSDLILRRLRSSRLAVPRDARCWRAPQHEVEYSSTAEAFRAMYRFPKNIAPLKVQQATA